MATVYVVVKKHYADFDIPIEDIIGVSLSEVMAKDRAAALNARRKPLDISLQEEYKVRPTKLIGETL